MMKKLLLFLLMTTLPALGQYMPATWYGPAYAPNLVSVPTFSPSSPYTGSPTSVTITQGAIPATGQTIYYCYSGSTCAPSTVYSTAISFTTSGYICAYAAAAGSGYGNSGTTCWVGTNPNCSGTCADNFSGTVGTPLATYNGAWVSYNNVNQVAHFELGPSANEVQSLSTNSDAGALYSLSTSNFSTLLFPVPTGTVSVREVCVFATSYPTAGTQSGYCVRLTTPATVGGNYISLVWSKAGSYVTSSTISVASTSAVWLTLGVVPSGSNEVETVYINGSSVATYTDTSSVITSGIPGFLVDPTASADNYFGGVGQISWCDYLYPCL
jgi:hypothetical protein